MPFCFVIRLNFRIFFMYKSERLIWLVLVLILSFILFKIRSDMHELSTWVDTQSAQIEEINELLNQAEVLVNDLPDEQQTAGLPDWERRILIANGLQNPEEELKSDLMNKSELIPVNPILGGTMHIYSKKDIRILPGGWVYAVFEDGHINGAMILSYTVEDGSINWDLISHKQF